MSTTPNPFIGTYLPDLFWPSLIATFGSEVTYTSKTGGSAPVWVLWKEGASDEDVSPGRYSHMDVQHSDLPAPPLLGDQVVNGAKQYDVVRIDALAVGFSVIVLQEAGPVL
jgi:hypothetical protein